MHSLYVVYLMRELLAVGVELVKFEVWVTDHSAFNVESAVPDKDHDVSWLGGAKIWRCAA